MITSMFAVVMNDYPRYPRWSPRCLSPLAYILSFWPGTMVTMLKAKTKIQLSGVMCPPTCTHINYGQTHATISEK